MHTGNLVATDLGANRRKDLESGEVDSDCERIIFPSLQNGLSLDYVEPLNKEISAKPPSSPPQKRHELNADSAPPLKRKALYILLLRKTEVGKLT